ncbi:cupin domain-containing protein [Patescibacteria group bacterium]|nr:cupin domain-containing protein [Patescibacteria group bacterium]
MVEVGIKLDPEIKKKVLIERGIVPQLMTFGEVMFKPGQRVEEHKHDTMFEVFFVQRGRAKFVVNGKEVLLKEGDCLTVEPGEVHSQANPFEGDVTWLYFGIATD